jgi:hypothetical protein
MDIGSLGMEIGDYGDRYIRIKGGKPEIRADAGG